MQRTLFFRIVFVSLFFSHSLFSVLPAPNKIQEVVQYIQELFSFPIDVLKEAASDEEEQKLVAREVFKKMLVHAGGYATIRLISYALHNYIFYDKDTKIGGEFCEGHILPSDKYQIMEWLFMLNIEPSSDKQLWSDIMNNSTIMSPSLFEVLVQAVLMHKIWVVHHKKTCLKKGVMSKPLLDKAVITGKK